MADESANVAGEAVRAALEFSVSASTTGFSVSLKIDNTILAGIVSVGALSLGAYYLANRRPVENAIRNGLEIRNEAGVVDPEVRNIEEGSIIVELHCHSEHSFIQFVEDFEAKKVELRLKEEFTKIGFSGRLHVTIRNAKEVYRNVQMVRSSKIESKAKKVEDKEVQKASEGEKSKQLCEREEKESEQPSKQVTLENILTNLEAQVKDLREIVIEQERRKQMESKEKQNQIEESEQMKQQFQHLLKEKESEKSKQPCEREEKESEQPSKQATLKNILTNLEAQVKDLREIIIEQERRKQMESKEKQNQIEELEQLKQQFQHLLNKTETLCQVEQSRQPSEGEKSEDIFSLQAEVRELRRIATEREASVQQRKNEELEKKMKQYLAWVDMFLGHSEKRLKDISSEGQNRLVAFLQPKHLFGNDYRRLADKLGYSTDVIKYLESTNEPVKTIIKDKGDMKIVELITLLEDMERKDVVEELQRILKATPSPKQIEQRGRTRENTMKLLTTCERYDAFICFGENDRQFVDLLTKKMEGPPYRLHLCLSEWDFLPGGSIYDITAEAIERCSKFVIILSKHFEDSDGARYESQISMSLSPGDKEKRFIPVLIDEDYRGKIPRSFSHIPYLDFLRLEENEFWKKLATSLGWNQHKA